ncbi:MAG: hypothetical protein JXQ91_07670 [Vannielia sp.]|uniref:hypothetical protein n=1 Tax=Vannielia sp. TaxID=2813045 RepID=UPI003B8B33BA
MSGNVVNFPDQKDEIWVCGCGCSSFQLNGDGSTECAACGGWCEDNSGWYAEISDGPELDPSINPISDIQGNGSVDFARRRVRQLAGQEDAALLIVATTDGAVSVWCNAETPEQMAWHFKRLSAAHTCLKELKGSRSL